MICENDTFDTYTWVFESWPFIAVREHMEFGRVLVLGQTHGSGPDGRRVYCGPIVGGKNFGALDYLDKFVECDEDEQRKIKLVAMPGKDTKIKFFCHVNGLGDDRELYRHLFVHNGQLVDGQQATDQELLEFAVREDLLPIVPRLQALAAESGSPITICPDPWGSLVGAVRFHDDGHWERCHMGGWEPCTFDTIASLATHVGVDTEAARILEAQGTARDRAAEVSP